jgi:hypothetical protein
MVKVDRGDDFAALHALPFDGRDFYLTEFVDYKSPDGLGWCMHQRSLSWTSGPH